MSALQLIYKISKFLLKFLQFFLLFPIHNLSFCEVTLLKLNLFLKYSEFLVSLDKLCSKNISLINNHFKILIMSLFLCFQLLDNIFQPGNMIFLVFYHFLSRFDCFHDSFFFQYSLLILLDDFIILKILIDKFIILLFDLFLVLIDHLFVSLLLFLKFIEFFLAIEQILRIKIPI